MYVENMYWIWVCVLWRLFEFPKYVNWHGDLLKKNFRTVIYDFGDYWSLTAIHTLTKSAHRYSFGQPQVLIFFFFFRVRVHQLHCFFPVFGNISHLVIGQKSVISCTGLVWAIKQINIQSPVLSLSRTRHSRSPHWRGQSKLTYPLNKTSHTSF